MTALNPVMRRELVERWRGRRAVATITVYLAVLGGILYLLYRVGLAALAAQLGFGADTATAGPALGRFLFDGLLFSVLLLVLFVSPGYAAAQLSGERERRTLPLLQLTLLRPHQIVLGKLGASVAWLTLLVTAALPLGAATFFLGGVALPDLLFGGLFILVVAVGVAGVALGISSLTRRTTAAVVLTYATVLALSLGTGFLAIVEFVLTSRGPETNSTPVSLYANPFFGLADAAGAGDVGEGLFGGFGFGLPSPLAVLSQAHPDVLGRNAMMAEEVAVAVDGGDGMIVQPDPGGGAAVRERRPIWLVTAGLYLVLGALGFAVATRRVRPTAAPSRLARPARAAPPPAGASGGGPGNPAAPALATQPPAVAAGPAPGDADGTAGVASPDGGRSG